MKAIQVVLVGFISSLHVKINASSFNCMEIGYIIAKYFLIKLDRLFEYSTFLTLGSPFPFFIFFFGTTIDTIYISHMKKKEYCKLLIKFVVTSWSNGWKFTLIIALKKTATECQKTREKHHMYSILEAMQCA